MDAPGGNICRKSSMATYCAGGPDKREFGGCKMFDQSRTTRTSSSLTLRCDGRTRNPGGYEPSGYR